MQRRMDPDVPEDTLPSDGSATESPSVEELIAEYDEERPGRRLSRPLEAAVTAYCFLISLVVLKQVFAPLKQGGQFYLMLFLAGVLPLVFLCYRMRAGRSAERNAGTGVAEPATDDAPREGGAGHGGAHAHRHHVSAAEANEGTLRHPSRPDGSDNPPWYDWILAALALAVCLYPIVTGFNAFLDRQGQLSPTDVAMGAALMVLILEATRRTTGLVLPAFCLVFFGYAYYGGFLPVSWPISHAGIDFSQIMNAFYNDASGFFGVPLDVCASYIVLFTIYGAVLDATGAGRFFIDISFATFKKSRSAPGRTVALSGFLLGTVSGSGTATAVSLGSVAWPILKRAGYPRENAGGMLAAAGIGAILSPPTLGAAAFIIAEYLNVNYLEVLLWATVPTVLYYLGIILAVEIDARRFGAREVAVPAQSALKLLMRFGYHFASLFVIVVFLAMNIPPFKAVVYATIVAAVFGLVERAVSRRDPLDPQDPVRPLGQALRDYATDMYAALAQGIRAVLPVAAVCAAAGIITSVIVKTGLGQNLAGMLVDASHALAGGNPTVALVLGALFSAIAIGVLGLAVPVTASFIISWVIIGPALQTMGASAPETAMFIFYYAVLSEVSPPTALAAVAASAITGGDAIRTMWQAMKYTAPAFLAPLAFVLTENGSHLLLQGDLLSIAWTTLVSMVAVAALAVVLGGWMFHPASTLVRALCLPAALLLLYLQPMSIGVGVACLVAAALLNLAQGRRTRHAT